MKCPECGAVEDLTWVKYFKHPFSKFICESCGTRYSFVRPISYWFIYSFAVLLCFGAHIANVEIYGTDKIILKVTVITGIFLLIYLPIDKAIESRYATKKI